MIDEKIIELSADLRKAFVVGTLLADWYRAYQSIFDETDLRNGQNQRQHHFLEWYCAVMLFQRHGWLSLVEKYGRFREEGRKLEVMERFRNKGLVSHQLYELMKNPRQFGFPARQQCPDLFVYSSDYSEFHFVETKWVGEPFHGQQAPFFETLEKESGRSVEVIRFKENANPVGRP